MEKLNYFNYCALAVMAVLLISVAARHMLKGRRNRYFWNLLLIVTIGVVLDIIAVHLDNGGGNYVLEKYVAHCAYLVMINLAVPVYVIYLACLTDGMYKVKDSLPMQLVLAAPYVVLFELIVTTPYTHLIFYIDEAYRYIEEGHFAKGSMLPKIEASIKFVEDTGKKAIITDLNNLSNAIKGIDCTEIYK